LDDPKDIRKYSERRLRNWYPSHFIHIHPPVKKKPVYEHPSDVPEKRRVKWKKPPKITVVEVDEPLPRESLERLKHLVTKAALRKLKELE